MTHQLWLIRHGETEWSKTGAHTGWTDIPLTSVGERNAAMLAPLLTGARFSAVFTSPLQRARETCRLAGFGDRAVVDPNLLEWNYGDYEGRTTSQIREVAPDWNLWEDGVPNGEAIEQVAARAQAVIDRACQADGDVALFAHGHILRILGACWLGLTPATAALFAMTTSSVSTLGYERTTRVITRWNLTASA